MADSTLNAFVAQFADAAARTAFVPSPPSPASGPESGYFAFQQDTGAMYAWDSNSSAWVLLSSGGATIPATVQGDLLYASASNTLSALAKSATATRYLSNTGGSNNPAWAQVDVTNGVTGTLPAANGGTGVTDAPPVHLQSFTLTNAEIKVLPTPATYKTIVAAPGANLAAVFQWGFLYINADAGAYASIDAGDQQGFTFAYGDWLVDASSFYTFTGTTFAARLGQFVTIGTGGYPSINNGLLGNTAIKLVAWNSVDYTGGNAANTGKGVVAYSLFNFTTGAWT